MTDNKIEYDIEAIITHNEAGYHPPSQGDEQILKLVYTILEGRVPWDAEWETASIKKLKPLLKEYGVKPSKDNIKAIYANWDFTDDFAPKKWYESCATHEQYRSKERLTRLGYHMRKLRNSWTDIYRDKRVMMCWDVEAGRPVKVPDDAPQELKDLQAATNENNRTTT